MLVLSVTASPASPARWRRIAPLSYSQDLSARLLMNSCSTAATCSPIVSNCTGAYPDAIAVGVAKGRDGVQRVKLCKRKDLVTVIQAWNWRAGDLLMKNSCICFPAMTAVHTGFAQANRRSVRRHERNRRSNEVRRSIHSSSDY